MSLREALDRRKIPATRIYIDKRCSVFYVGVSEWAETLTVISAVIWRALRNEARSPSELMSPLHAAMEILDSLKSLVVSMYFFPRLVLGCLVACCARAAALDLQKLAESFFRPVRAACMQESIAPLGFYQDLPNLHRHRQLVEYVIPALLHVRHVLELSFEKAHQQLKRAVVTGNGHDDVDRAMSRYIGAELVTRLRMDPVCFSVPTLRMQHAGVRSYLSRARPVISGGGTPWSCAGGKLCVLHSPLGA